MNTLTLESEPQLSSQLPEREWDTATGRSLKSWLVTQSKSSSHAGPRHTLTHRMKMLLNPYVVSGPVGDTGAFVGRSDVLRQAVQTLQRSQENAVALYGQRRIGKTSILQHMAYWIPRGGPYGAVYFDLQDKGQWPMNRLLRELARTITGSLEQPEPDLGSEAENDFRHKWLPAIFSRLPENFTLMLLFDEFDALDESQAGHAMSIFFSYLRGVLADYDHRLQVVLAIGRNPSDLAQITLSLFNGMPTQRVSLLSKTDTTHLMRLSEKNGTLAWPDEAVERVWYWTHGHPFLTQQLCFHVWKQNHSNGELNELPIATMANVDAAVPSTLKASRSALEWWWDGLPATEQTVISAIAQAGPGLVKRTDLERLMQENSTKDIAQAWRDAPRLLQNLDLIQPVNGSYHFQVNLLRQWTAQYKPLTNQQAEMRLARTQRRFHVESFRRWIAGQKPLHRTQEGTESLYQDVDETQETVEALANAAQYQAPSTLTETPGNTSELVLAQPETIIKPCFTPATQKTTHHLSAWNPLDYVRLLWWTLVTSPQLNAHRQQYGQEEEWKLSGGLVSTLIWLPLLIPTLALGLGLIPFVQGAFPSALYLGLAVILTLAWLFMGWVDSGHVAAMLVFILAIILAITTTGSIAGSLAISPVGITIIGLMSITTLTIAATVADIIKGNMAGDIAVGMAGGIAGGMVFGMLFGPWGGVASGLAVGIGISIAMGISLTLTDEPSNDAAKITIFMLTAIVMGGLAGGVIGSQKLSTPANFGGNILANLGLGMASALAFIATIFASARAANLVKSSVEKTLKTTPPITLARCAFVVLVLAYTFLIWFSFLDGWRLLP